MATRVFGVKIKSTLAACSAFTLAAAASLNSASAITVDGDLSDWNVVVADNNASVFGTVNVSPTNFFEEDQDDTSNSHYLGPNWGGQNYDAEFMAVARQGGDLFVAISTGQRPDNGEYNYSPGDLRIMLLNGDIYGVEFGGGSYTPDTGAAITEGAQGTTYTVLGNGHTAGGGVTNHAVETAGSIWKNANWILDPLAPQMPVQIDHDGLGVFAGTADYIYSRNAGVPGYYTGTQHAIIELSIGLGDLGGDVNLIESIQWRPSCGNDELIVNPRFPPGQTFPPMPEPLTSVLSLMGLATVLCGVTRRGHAMV
jgi:hypothetical protein